MNLQELQKEEKELLDLLSENRSKQRELSKIDFIQKHGFDIRDTVEVMNGNTAQKGVISEIQFIGQSASYYIVTLFKSDGSIGKRVLRIWSNAVESMKLVDKAS